jgi:phosphoserine phosphatase RsbU/P
MNFGVNNELLQLEESFEDFFEETLCGYVVSDKDGIIKRTNTKITLWTGSTAAELHGKHFSNLLSVGGRIYYETHLGPLLRMQGYFEEVVLELKNKTGEKLRVLVNGLERRDQDGRPLFIRYTILKSTDRQLYEQNLLLAKNIAEHNLIKQTEMVALREQLIAVLGHDLRNPLSAITMAVNLMEVNAPAENNTDLLALLKRSSLRMTELVGNIMDFAKTRLGNGILLDRKEVELPPVMQQVIDELQLTNRERDIISVFTVTKPVYCDSDRIAQLLSNLVANALTHGSDKTPIYIHASNSGGMFELSVTNNGEPIPPDMQEQIFAPFTRETNRSSQHGLGLGLYISKEIARAHGGSLKCSSTPEKTVFTFCM